MKIAVLGITGMLGSAMFRVLTGAGNFNVCGTSRSGQAKHFFDKDLHPFIITGIDAENFDSLTSFLNDFRPDVVVNCIGVVKQLSTAKDPLVAIPINSTLPHRLARLCKLGGARLIHISTDCVFSGNKGLYKEADFPDADDIYGRTKLLGEVDYENAITLRTSIIGHELDTRHGLVEWFLSRKDHVKGFSRAIFSGVTTNELAKIIKNYLLKPNVLRGVYHVSAAPIDKYRLLKLIGKEYGVPTQIERDDKVIIDRSLDSTRFQEATRYSPKDWEEMIAQMRQEQVSTVGSKE